MSEHHTPPSGAAERAAYDSCAEAGFPLIDPDCREAQP